MRDVGDYARLACVLEATARKPGNVHPGAAFADCSYADFVRSAWLIGPAFENAASRRVGQIVLDGVQRTREHVPHNTNLGMLLLLAPLAVVPQAIPLQKGIGKVLGGLTRGDAEHVYAAIRLANPGGLGSAPQEDVADGSPQVTLLEAMQLAANRDRIAAQYADRFSTVFAGVDHLAGLYTGPPRWEESVIRLHLWLMSEFPDTLIARKLGRGLAEESARRAGDVLAAGWPVSEAGRQGFADLDAWLRADGNRRNPGTSADLVAACLFAAFRDRRIEPPPIPEFASKFLPEGASL